MDSKIKELLKALPKEEIKEKAAKLLAAASLDEVKSILKESKIEATDEQCEKILSALKAKTEIADEELDFVSGGAAVAGCNPDDPSC